MRVASGSVLTVRVEKMPSPWIALVFMGCVLSTTMMKVFPLRKAAIPILGGMGKRMRLTLVGGV